MKKSVEILGLPIISITEGRELGMSKTLLIDAANGKVAALTIEDEDWYRGVKLLPYDSVIAIGHDAVTITNSENILTLENAGDFQAMMDANVRIIGTKAITKSGTIQGVVDEIYIGEDGKIEKCDISTPDGVIAEIHASDISIFGKQVTIIDSDKAPEKKAEAAAPAPAAQAPTPAPSPSAQAPAAPKAEVKNPEGNKPMEKKAEPKAEEKKADNQAKQADKATEERHRRFMIGKKASRKITTDNGVTICEEGAVVTEEILQKAQLANKVIELSMVLQ